MDSLLWFFHDYLLVSYHIGLGGEMDSPFLMVSFDRSAVDRRIVEKLCGFSRRKPADFFLDKHWTLYLILVYSFAPKSAPDSRYSSSKVDGMASDSDLR